MEDAEHYHQWSNLLLDEYNFSLDFECQFPTTCCCVEICTIYLVIIGHNRQSESSTNVSYCQAVLIPEGSCGSMKPWKTSTSKHS